MKKPDFKKLRKQIKKEFKDEPCWKCLHFKGYYFDSVTLDCEIEGDNWMWAFVDKDCKYFKKSKESNE